MAGTATYHEVLPTHLHPVFGEHMKRSIDDVRIGNAQPLITPWVLAEELPLPEPQAQFIADSRHTIENVLSVPGKKEGGHHEKH